MNKLYIQFQVNVVINNGQSLKTTLAFVAKLGAVVSLKHIVFLFSTSFKVKVDLEAAK